MSIHGDIFKVMACLTVFGLAAAPAHEAQAQTTQQSNCDQQSGQNCMQNSPKIDPNSQLQGGGAYDKPSSYFAPGASQETPANPQANPQNKPNSGQ
ncbi:MAG: hypothetical protein KGL97_18300 [Alphaproteobacteria bacterium]|nr:hypothetical protein [Alphaproteobacteria bacterium]